MGRFKKDLENLELGEIKTSKLARNNAEEVQGFCHGCFGCGRCRCRCGRRCRGRCFGCFGCFFCFI